MILSLARYSAQYYKSIISINTGDVDPPPICWMCVLGGDFHGAMDGATVGTWLGGPGAGTAAGGVVGAALGSAFELC